MVRIRVGVIICNNREVLEVVARLKSRVDFTLIGNELETKSLAINMNIPLEHVLFINEPDDFHACNIGAQLADEKKVDILMKGRVHTGVFIKAILNKELSLIEREGSLISLVSRVSLPGYHKPLYITDPGININPDINQKAEIIRNAISVVKALGLKNPKVACISPVEVVNPKIVSSVDADILSKEYSFPGAIVEGPLSFDIAVSRDAAEIKGINTPVAGDADILLFPNIDIGNALYKSLTIFGNGKVAGVISGLKLPVILTSRADSIETKISSVELAIDMIQQEFK